MIHALLWLCFDSATAEAAAGLDEGLSQLFYLYYIEGLRGGGGFLLCLLRRGVSVCVIASALH